MSAEKPPALDGGYRQQTSGRGERYYVKATARVDLDPERHPAPGVDSHWALQDVPLPRDIVRRNLTLIANHTLTDGLTDDHKTELGLSDQQFADIDAITGAPRTFLGTEEGRNAWAVMAVKELGSRGNKWTSGTNGELTHSGPWRWDIKLQRQHRRAAQDSGDMTKAQRGTFMMRVMWRTLVRLQALDTSGAVRGLLAPALAQALGNDSLPPPGGDADETKKWEMSETAFTEFEGVLQGLFTQATGERDVYKYVTQGSHTMDLAELLVPDPLGGAPGMDDDFDMGDDGFGDFDPGPMPGPMPGPGPAAPSAIDTAEGMFFAAQTPPMPAGIIEYRQAYPLTPASRLESGAVRNVTYGSHVGERAMQLYTEFMFQDAALFRTIGATGNLMRDIQACWASERFRLSEMPQIAAAQRTVMGLMLHQQVAIVPLESVKNLRTSSGRQVFPQSEFDALCGWRTAGTNLADFEEGHPLVLITLDAVPRIVGFIAAEILTGEGLGSLAFQGDDVIDTTPEPWTAYADAVTPWFDGNLLLITALCVREGTARMELKALLLLFYLLWIHEEPVSHILAPVQLWQPLVPSIAQAAWFHERFQMARLFDLPTPQQTRDALAAIGMPEREAAETAGRSVFMPDHGPPLAATAGPPGRALMWRPFPSAHALGELLDDVAQRRGLEGVAAATAPRRSHRARPGSYEGRCVPSEGESKSDS